MDVVQEDLGVSLLVLVLIAEGQAQQLAGVTGRPLQFNFLKIFQFNIMEIFCCFVLVSDDNLSLQVCISKFIFPL